MSGDTDKLALPEGVIPVDEFLAWGERYASTPFNALALATVRTIRQWQSWRPSCGTPTPPCPPWTVRHEHE